MSSSRLFQRRRVGKDTFHPVLDSISGDTLVLGLKRKWALELRRIVKRGNTLTLRTLCTLRLPAVRWTMETKLSNFNRTSSTTASPSASLGRSALPFRSSPSDSVLSFAVDVRHGKNPFVPFVQTKRFYFYALPSGLRDLVQRVTMPARDNSARRWLRSHLPPVIRWDDWGPETTRWIRREGTRQVLSISGMRCALSVKSGDSKDVRVLTVLDFNPGRLRRIVTVRETEENGKRTVERQPEMTEPNIIERGRCFKRDFQSNLPCKEIKRVSTQGDIFMDDEWIAQIKVCLSDYNVADMRFNLNVAQYNEPSGADGGSHTILVHSVVGSGT
jgi:hypothetical protein